MGDVCAWLLSAPVHINSYGRAFVEGILLPGPLRAEMFRMLCMRLSMHAIIAAHKQLPGGQVNKETARACQRHISRATPYFITTVVKRKPRRWPHHGVAGYAQIPKNVLETAQPEHNETDADTVCESPLLSVFDWIETIVDASSFGAVVSNRSIRYVRITFCGFLCPDRLILNQCERRLLRHAPPTPYQRAGENEAREIPGAAEQVVVYLVPRVDIVYDPLAALGQIAQDTYAVTAQVKHAVGQSSVYHTLDVAAACHLSESDSDRGGDFEPSFDADVAHEYDSHSDHTNGTSHSESGDELPPTNGTQSEDCVVLDAPTSTPESATPATTKLKKSKKRARKAAKRKLQRDVAIVDQTFGGVRRDVGLALPPSVSEIRASAANKDHEAHWSETMDMRDVLKHLERWLVCIAGVAKTKRATMSRLLQRIDNVQTERPFLDMVVQALLCTAVCEDEHLGTVFMNTYGDLVQCQITGVVQMNRQRDIMARYNCAEYEAKSQRAPARLWHVRVRNAVVAQVGKTLLEYNRFVKDRGGVVEESMFRSTVNAAREYLTTEVQAVRRPLSHSVAAEPRQSDMAFIEEGAGATSGPRRDGTARVTGRKRSNRADSAESSQNKKR